MPQISKKITQLLTEQIHAEFQAHNSYLAMAAFFERGAFKGFASWMRLQAEEEHVDIRYLIIWPKEARLLF